MRKYDAILFDLDDTLIDNDESMKYAIYEICKSIGISWNDDIFMKWKQFDIDYWSEWENGTFIFPHWANSQHQKIDFLRAYRFVIFFKDVSICYEKAVDINKLYNRLLSKNVVPIDGAYELISNLSNNYELVISTNGDKNAAYNKVRVANMLPYIDKIIASGECGYSKPMPEFFKYVIDRMNTKNRNKMLIVGDSLRTDILGGIYSGIDCCWFNQHHKENNLGMNPTYEINHLKELIKKL